MLTPVRLQRSRQHKLVSPNGLPTVYVGRPSKWGNPFPVGDKLWKLGVDVLISPKMAVELFKAYLGERELLQLRIKSYLKSKNLVCWCPLDQPCHADILLKIANEK